MSRLIEQILERDNMNLAYKKVCANKGASGIDEVTIEELSAYIKELWPDIVNEIRERKYTPQPVKRRYNMVILRLGGRMAYTDNADIRIKKCLTFLSK